jgi:hypothetical protein
MLQTHSFQKLDIFITAVSTDVEILNVHDTQQDATHTDYSFLFTFITLQYCSHIRGLHDYNRFKFDDQIYWTFIKLATTFHKSLSSNGHSTSDHTTFIQYLSLSLSGVKVKFKVKVTLKLAVYCQLVCLGVKPLKTNDHRFLLPTEPLWY